MNISDSSEAQIQHWRGLQPSSIAGLCDPGLAAILAPALDEVDVAVMAQALTALAGLLQNHQAGARTTARARRLRTAMRSSAT